MSAQRIKGQEVQVLITRAGVLEDTLTDIQNLNLELESEIKIMGYLGEKTNRKDDIYNGIKGDLEFHHHSQDWLRFVNAVIDRQKRNTPDLIINITAVLFYPNGDNPVIMLPDVKFGALPINTTSRGDYVKNKFNFEADDFTIQFS